MFPGCAEHSNTEGTHSKYSLNIARLLALCLFSLSVNDNIVDIEKADEICSHYFVLDKFSLLPLYLSIS